MVSSMSGDNSANQLAGSRIIGFKNPTAIASVTRWLDRISGWATRMSSASCLVLVTSWSETGSVCERNRQTPIQLISSRTLHNATPTSHKQTIQKSDLLERNPDLENRELPLFDFSMTFGFSGAVNANSSGTRSCDVSSVSTAGQMAASSGNSILSSV